MRLIDTEADQLTTEEIERHRHNEQVKEAGQQQQAARNSSAANLFLA